MYDLPGTTSCFYIWAPYGRDEDVAEIVVGEAVMVGLLGLYEDQDYYNILKGLNIPSCMSGIHCPLVGLNREPGLKYAFHETSIKASTSTSNTQLAPQDHQRRKKLNDLVTTGFPVSVTARARKRAGVQIRFGLLGHKVPMSASYLRSVPTLIDNEDATAFVDLCYHERHPHPFYTFDEDHPELQHFGIWLVLADGTGFWLERSKDGMNSLKLKNEAIENARSLARDITWHYGLIDEST